MTALKPPLLFAAAAVILVLGFQLWISPHNPPGFHHDEAAFALNAYTIGHHLRDQDGALLPIMFPSYGDYKSSFFSYALAPFVAVFGPSDGLVRVVAALFGIASIVLVGWLASRRAGPWIGVAAACLAGLTPWLFQNSRVAYDTSSFPFAVALVFVAADFWARSSARLGARAVVLGAALAIATYGYAAGRLLAPLLALALLVFVPRLSTRAVAAVWLVYGVLLAPLVSYRFRHPSGLVARYHETTFITPGMSWWSIFTHALANYLTDMDPLHWVVAGDPKPYVDVANVDELLAALVIVAAIGVYAIVRRHGDRFWWYALAAYLLSAIPAALTVDRHDSLRLSAMPVCLAVLAIPGIQEIARWRRSLRLVTCAVLAAAALGQWAYFVNVYATKGGYTRAAALDAGVPALLQRGFAGGRSIYIDHDDAYARTYAEWYAVSHGLPLGRVIRLPDGGVPPTGSMVFGRTQSCDYRCPQLAAADSFWLARAAGPNPTG